MVRPSKSRAAATPEFSGAGSNQVLRPAVKFPLRLRGRFAHCFHSHFQTLFALVFVGANPKRDVPGRRRQRMVRRAEENRAMMIVLLPKPQLQMFLANDARFHDRFNRPREKDRLWVTVAERLEHFVPAEKIEV